jgi:hypothetical protein
MVQTVLLVFFLLWLPIGGVFAQDTHQAVPSAVSARALVSHMPPHAQTYGGTTAAAEQRAWWGDALSGYVPSGGNCQHATSGTTSASIAGCRAYALNPTAPMALEYLEEPSAQTVTYSGGNGTYWLIAHATVAEAVAGWTREVGTHYLWQLSASQPALPSRAVWLAKVTVSGGTISTVVDRRNRLFTAPETFSASVTTAADTVWRFAPGTVNTVATGVTVTHNGAVQASLKHQVVSLSGTGILLLPNQPVVYPEWWGAVSGSGADSGLAIENAIRSTAPKVVLTGQYTVSQRVRIGRNNVMVEGASAAASVTAIAGFSDTAGNRGVFSIGSDTANNLIAVSGVTLRGFTVNGLDLVRPIYGHACSNCVVEYMTSLNSGPTHGSISFYLGSGPSADVLVQYSTVTGALGEFGDGIYFEAITRPKALYNVVSDFTRIGIVTEGDAGSNKTVDALIQGNRVFFAHDATVAEANAAIWLENTLGGWVIGNLGANLDNTPGAQLSRGINIGPGSGGAGTFLIADNDMSGASHGMVIAAAATDTVIVRGFSHRKGTMSAYASGISILGGYAVDISGCVFGVNAFAGDGHGTIVIDEQNGAAINRISISDCGVEGPTHTTGSGDLNIFSLVDGITYLILRNLQNWKVQMREFPVHLLISDSQLTYNSTTPR